MINRFFIDKISANFAYTFTEDQRKAIEKIVDLMDKYNMGYGSVNHTRIRCIDCGHEYVDTDSTSCPKCGSENLDIIARITGYLVGGLDKWNEGKKSEREDRVIHGN